MAVDLAALIADLGAESAELDGVLGGLRASDFDRPTPAAGWTIRGQVTHLAFFDDAAVTAASDPARFRDEAPVSDAQVDSLGDRVAERYRMLPPNDALTWFRAARGRYLEVFADLDPAASLPWYGPPMSVASSVTARLMETWAHGQDIHDALGLTRWPTARLRHVAHLGVRTIGWSFRVHGRPEPDVPVRVELAAPESGTWTWGPRDATDRVTGSAEDFCLLVTQRRHRRQTALSAQGPIANGWLDVAQAFAGPPGDKPSQRDPE
ncbi:TIGR03084 family protein [Frankia sp. AgB1.9]|uniref:TIGR03084 family metal-binding protein n=1 Tax=unclassified Frankia TaxID=2632575 RepID=UPI0019331D55|nr:MULTISPECIES: TIGR03084 family metal-binding protein [unclassified Frankia]MBL7487670.1 TIGR03084 family protein [Frankia sp. AgW1.1]MBL7550048.1 TIGR03084 family protein [Frankia sp. AgB1.9]MBL7621757.1 TIGR03084 family protein [Frankia sp. AgB1.8]